MTRTNEDAPACVRAGLTWPLLLGEERRTTHARGYPNIRRARVGAAESTLPRTAKRSTDITSTCSDLFRHHSLWLDRDLRFRARNAPWLSVPGTWSQARVRGRGCCESRGRCEAVETKVRPDVVRAGGSARPLGAARVMALCLPRLVIAADELGVGHADAHLRDGDSEGVSRQRSCAPLCAVSAAPSAAPPHRLHANQGRVQSSPPSRHPRCQSKTREERGLGTRGARGGTASGSVRGTHTYTPAPRQPPGEGLKPRARIICALAVEVPAVHHRATRERAPHDGA